MKKTITEETSQDLIKQWYAEARKQTAESLPVFMRGLIEDFSHDYGTICHAIAAAALAGAYTIEHSPQGGITGFQSSAVMWEFIKHWQSLDGKPLRLTDYSDMLYPQSRHKFTSITPSTLEYLRKEAISNLANHAESAHPEVVAHWEKLAAGEVPFGFGVNAD